MGKRKNKQHRPKRDTQGHKERSKQEHKLRKERKAQAAQALSEEQSRYHLSSASKSKLLKALRDLLAHSSSASSEIPSVFQMLDDGLEVDIVDVEDGFVREKLEVVFTAMEGMIERREDDGGKFVYAKICARPVREQVEKYMKEAQEAPREAWMTGLAAQLEQQLGPSPCPNPTSIPQASNPVAEAYMEEYNRINRPKSLLELHKERKGNTGNSQAEGYLYGVNTLQKRFSKGAFL